MAVVYLVALTFLLFQNYLKDPMEPTADILFDEFVIAHILGWWGKAIMIRNQPLLWVLSIGFELMELTFRHMLPNFNECWWDSIVLDILICNWFGIWAGMKTVRYFDGRTYEWVGLSRQPNIMSKVKRTLGQFTPAQWDKDEWYPLLGPWRFIQVLILPLDSSPESLDCLPTGPLVVDCDTNHPRIQHLFAGQEL
uniref:CDP-diacylglycerol--serine O-phosphatidyltransferase n=1 Tax=Aegilops tauschii subsp. strangulata TaxID=200361 RepID=A0A453DRW3_AEGTS